MGGAGHVSAGDARTAAAGAALLTAGGNAVDAAVGATLAAFAAEPVLTAPFGGGFALLGAANAAPVAYDFFAAIPGIGLAPAKSVPELEFLGLEVSFGPTTQVFHAGRGAAAVGLLLPGLVQLQSEHGRLPLHRVVQPAAALAKTGVTLSAQVAPIAKILTPILTLTPETAALFAPRGPVLGPGELFLSPLLADFLMQVAQNDTSAGKPQLLAAFAPPTGRLTTADLAQNDVKQRPPIRVELGEYTVCLNPPPSLGGLLVAFGLQLLAPVPASVWRDETQTMAHLLACMAITQRLRQGQVDPAARSGSAALEGLATTLLAAGPMDGWRNAMHQAAAAGPLAGGEPQRNLGSTTHVSAMDADGMACCITSSNGEGCGHLVPGAGFMANNFLGEEDINPGGFHLRPAGERMTSMMCPTLVLKGGKPVLALGTGGSNRIRTALLQVLVHHLLRGLPLETAVLMPRLHYEGGALFLERHVLGMQLSDATQALLGRYVPQVVHFDTPNMFFGGVHVAAYGQRSVGDPRRGGAVAAG